MIELLSHSTITRSLDLLENDLNAERLDELDWIDVDFEKGAVVAVDVAVEDDIDEIVDCEMQTLDFVRLLVNFDAKPNPSWFVSIENPNWVVLKDKVGIQHEPIEAMSFVQSIRCE